MRFWLLTAAFAVSLAAFPGYSGHAQTAPKPVPAQPQADAQSSSTEPAPPEPVPQKANPIIRAVLDQLKTSDRPSKRRSKNNTAKTERAALATYYEKYVEDPIWLTSDHNLNDRAKALIATLEDAGTWGLLPSEFTLPKSIDALTKQTVTADQTEPKTLANIEIALSTTALKYARHARGGRIPEPTVQLSSYIDRAPDLLSTDTHMDALRQRQDPDKYLESLHPKHPQFEKLRKALLDMRSGAIREPKPEDIKLPTTGPLLRLGRTHPDIALLRKRLSVPVEADTTPTDTPNENEKPAPKDPREVFDQSLKDAVEAFQKENGLYQDGLVGRSTRRSLNSIGSGAITQEILLANMEAWRWMPDDLGEIYVTVNIPEYKVRVVKNGIVIHEELAIVGKTNNQTPVFSDTLETVVIHPQWGVPNSIKVREIWPGLSRGAPVLQRQGLRIRKNGREINPNSINWAYADIRTYDVYQPPGARNVLGIVKFLFPNKHQVYMHDTPTKKLFKQTVRTYSHGCMRLQNPVRLAEIILEHDKNLSPDDVSELISTGPKQNRIVLDTKIPVHVTYFTAVVDDDGTVRRLNDVYGHEQRIKLALAGKFSQINVGRDHMKPVRYTRRNTQPQSFNEIFQSLFGGF